MKIVFTDLDGTLEDSRQDMAECVNRVRMKLGLSQRDIEALKPLVNRGMTELYKACFDDFFAARGNTPDAMEKVRVAYEADYYSNVANHTKLYDGIREVTEALSKTAKLVLVTNKPEKISRHLLDTLGIGKYYSVIMGGDSCAENKPSALPLRLAAERLGFASGETFMVGDSLADIQAGKAFGAKTIWCAWGYAATHGTETPDYVVKHASELVRIINRIDDAIRAT